MDTKDSLKRLETRLMQSMKDPSLGWDTALYRQMLTWLDDPAYGFNDRQKRVVKKMLDALQIGINSKDCIILSQALDISSSDEFVKSLTTRLGLPMDIKNKMYGEFTH